MNELPSGNYAAVAWCANCSGQKLHVIGVGRDLAGTAPLQLLRIPPSHRFPYWPLTIALSIATSLLAATALALRRKNRRQLRPLRG